MSNGVNLFTDYQGLVIRLTDERYTHILEHPEMVGQLARITETLAEPDTVVRTSVDDTVSIYHRYYDTTPVTTKHLLVVVKRLTDDAFVLTAFFSSRRKRGTVVWQK